MNVLKRTPKLFSTIKVEEFKWASRRTCSAMIRKDDLLAMNWTLGPVHLMSRLVLVLEILE
ncbi:hypothetical protein BSKO_08380 [Bryopsis sp. KO-2023]|nr:hypothetical protein BSKO_08380 [Bryopsis sp. KO-2023]